ncbi:gluconate 2-dehydrogenase subunit 3 family protein [Agaribacter flavus]|uniref:Gluconate 2-dehydrogenase subunit 3 family protein n=1 Tax=Agaribacter flavus TaxID=1902781 RepID=A0ABV7FQY5_9ALTE
MQDKYSDDDSYIGHIERRDFLKLLTQIAGTSAATAVLSGCAISTGLKYVHQRPTPPTDGSLLSDYEVTILKDICDTVLPKTDTPSASELNCHGFIEHQLTHCHTNKQQTDCMEIINKIDWYSQHMYEQTFSELKPQEKEDTLLKIEAEHDFVASDHKQFSFLKALIVFAYFTSQVGATKALNYQGVPGGFKGSIANTQDTKSWGSLDFY